MLLVLHKQLPAQNYKFQALFIFNIAQRIEWPELSDEFVIGVLGSNDLYKELNAIAQKRQLFGHTIRVKTIKSSSLNVEGCHLIYVGHLSAGKLNQVLAQISGDPVLAVGEKKGIKGVSINLIDNAQKIDFEIYPNTIKAHQLKVASSLLSLGVVKE